MQRQVLTMSGNGPSRGRREGGGREYLQKVRAHLTIRKIESDDVLCIWAKGLMEEEGEEEEEEEEGEEEGEEVEEESVSYITVSDEYVIHVQDILVHRTQCRVWWYREVPA